MPATIFHNTAVKALKDRLRFKTNEEEIIVNKSDSDIATGVAAPIGSIAITTDGNLFIKFDSADTDWRILSTGEATGFVNQTDSTYSFAPGTRTFSIQPAVSSFDIFQAGKQYTFTSTQSVVIPVTYDLHYFYFDNGVLSSTTTYDDSLITDKVLVATLAFAPGITVFTDRRYGIGIPSDTKLYLRNLGGLIRTNGFELNSITPDQDGSLDSHAQLGYAAGTLQDLNLLYSIGADSSPAQIPIYARIGAASQWTKFTATNFPFHALLAGIGRLSYNAESGGNWTLAEIAEGYYTMTHLFASSSDDAEVIGILGWSQHSTIESASNTAITEVLDIIDEDLLPFDDAVLIGTVIAQSSNSYTNSIKARIVSTASGSDHFNWLERNISRSNTKTINHDILDNLEKDAHLQYALLAGRSGGQVLYGGTDAGDDLTLDSTSDSTKGRLLLNSPTNFNTGVSTPTYAEGNVYWNSTDKTLDIQNDISDVTLQVGQEFLLRVYNDSGSTITNGQVVYISGTFGVNDRPTIALADASDTVKSKAAGLATHDIGNGEEGWVTYIGVARGLDTSSLSEGRVYLSADTPGALTNTEPTGGAFVVTLGKCLVSDPTDGIIITRVVFSELTSEVTDTNGFPSAQRSNTTLAFVDGTRTFTIAPVVTPFHYYQDGLKYEKTTSQSVVIDDTEGGHIIYFDGETLTALANPTFGNIDQIIRTKCLVAYLYWNATAGSLVFLNDERHGISMSPETHTYLHFSRGSQYLSGLALGDILADESGNLDAHAQFSTASGFITDEDLSTVIPAITSTTGLKIYYLDGANADLRTITNSGFSVLDDVTAGVGVTGRLVYNEYTGATWQLTTVASGNYVLCHVFASNSYDTSNAMFALIGQNDYSTTSTARAGATTEISSIVSQFPSPELVPIATVIFETKDVFGNSVKARIISTDAGEDYVDWRATELAQGTTPTAHNNLTGLELAQSTVTWGHIDDQAQTIAGAKTFSDPLTTSGLATIDTLTVLDAATFNGDAIFNYGYGANDFTVRKATSGNALNYSNALDVWSMNGDVQFDLNSKVAMTAGEFYLGAITDDKYGVAFKGSGAYPFASNTTFDGVAVWGQSGGVLGTRSAVGAETIIANWTLTDFRVYEQPIFNYAYGDEDFTIRKQLSGNAFVYDAGTDAFAVSSDMDVAATVTANKLQLGENEILAWNGSHFESLAGSDWVFKQDGNFRLRVNGGGNDNIYFYDSDGTTLKMIWEGSVTRSYKDFVSNSNYGDIDFSIRRQISGDAYKYDAGSDFHYFTGTVRINADTTRSDVMKFFDVTTSPTSNPTNGVEVYSDAGTLSFRTDDAEPLHIIRTDTGASSVNCVVRYTSSASGGTDDMYAGLTTISSVDAWAIGTNANLSADSASVLRAYEDHVVEMILSLSYNSLKFADATNTGGTEDGYITINIDGATRYIRTFTTS